MIALVLIVAASVAIVIVLRWMALAKQELVKLREKALTDFYAAANAMVDSNRLSDDDLTQLEWMSKSVRSRSVQLHLIRILDAVAKQGHVKDKRVAPREVDGWGSMFADWMMATLAQGSVMGAGGLLKLLAFIGRERTSPVMAKIERKLTPAFAR